MYCTSNPVRKFHDTGGCVRVAGATSLARVIRLHKPKHIIVIMYAKTGPSTYSLSNLQKKDEKKERKGLLCVDIAITPLGNEVYKEGCVVVIRCRNHQLFRCGALTVVKGWNISRARRLSCQAGTVRGGRLSSKIRNKCIGQ